MDGTPFWRFRRPLFHEFVGFIQGFTASPFFSKPTLYVLQTLSLVVDVFIYIDLWNISKGKFKHKITGMV